MFRSSLGRLTIEPEHKVDIKISDHFNYKKLLRFCLAPILMMVFTSIYGVVDGLFVSNFAGKTAFAAINLIMPFIMIIGGLGFMVGAGGTALIGKTLGEGKSARANQYFTMIIVFTVILGVTFAGLGVATMRPVARLLGATDEMMGYCVTYGCLVLCFVPCFMLQNIFQVIFPLAEKQKVGLWFTLAGGFTNIILDAVFVGGFRWGIVGAAVATGISQVVAGLLPIIYFFSKRNNSLLHFTKTKLEFKPLWLTCSNGVSELLSSISSSIVSIVYNAQLMRYAGENGVATYGVLMYVMFIFVAIFIGYTIGTTPLISYHYGAANHDELRNLKRKSLILNTICGVIMTVSAMALGRPLAQIFVGYDPDLLTMTVHAFLIASLLFMTMGVNIFISSFFTALNNGLISGIISVLRSLVFKIAAALLLPLWLGLAGIWWSMMFAEIMSLIISLTFLLAKKRRYHY